MKKIDIPKTELIELYSNNKLTMVEISKMYGVDRTTISNKLKKFNIKTDPRQRKFIKTKEMPLTKMQKELIFGSVLGDGSIILNQRRINSYFKVGHCERQKEYVLFKKSVLGNLVNCNVRKTIDKRNNSIMYEFNTLSHKDLNSLRFLFYDDNNIKIIQNEDEIISQLTSFGLAIWFMDDGHKNGNNYSFATEGFTKEENQILSNVLKNKFDLEVKVLTYAREKKQYYYLYMTKDNSIKMANIIRPYIVDCMKYKLIS